MALSCRFWSKFPLLTQRTNREGRGRKKDFVLSYTKIQFGGPTHADFSVMILNISPLIADQIFVT